MFGKEPDNRMAHRVISFPVDNVIPATKPIWTENLAKSLDRRFQRQTVFLPEPTLPVVNQPYDSFSKLLPGKILDQVGSRCHSLIEAVQIAFSQHRPLVLSPDSIWLAIAQGFSHHLAANAEVLRDRVVRCPRQAGIDRRLHSLERGECESGDCGLFGANPSGVGPNAAQYSDL